MGAAAMALPAYADALQNSSGRAKLPNVLFLFTDDQRFNALRAMDNPEIETPNMDRLARNGVMFTHAHIMGAMCGAVCMPSRAMLMSGRTLFHIQGRGEHIPPEHVTMPELLKRQGYVTFGTGKWHNGKPAYARSFTHGGNIFFGGMSNHLKVPIHDFDPTGAYPKETRHVGKKFSSELFSDTAIGFLKQHKGDQPFFAYVSYTAPHDPRMAPDPYPGMYPPEKIQLPENFMPEHPFDNGEMKIRDEKLAPWLRTPEVIREHIAAYYAMITHLDAHIGRILEALEETGHADNTIIIFAGDNGLAVGQHGLMGKQNLYEHSARVPLVLCGPGLPKGKRCDALCYLHDVFPTICELLGIPIPPSVESQSLVPLIAGRESALRDSVFGAYRHIQRMVRTDRWKLILYNVNGVQTTQLFDEQNDPWELSNLADDPGQADRVKELRALLRDWMKKLDDPCDIDRPNWGQGER